MSHNTPRSAPMPARRPRPYSPDAGHARLLIMAALFLVAFAGIGVRLVAVTMFNDTPGNLLARPGISADLTLQRADIVDRHGVLLASNLPTNHLYARPHKVRDPEGAAQAVAAVLNDVSLDTLLERLTADRPFVYLKRNLTPREQQAIITLGIPGLDFEASERRVYPQGHLLPHVIGLTDVDNNGIAGVEKAFDRRLKEDLSPLRLAVDVRVQHALRRHLARAMTVFQAKGAVGVVEDVRTGEVLAMVSLPDYDPNDPAEADTGARFNRVTLGTYEMGSTFKLFNTAAALEAGVVTLEQRYDTTRPIRYASHTIRDLHPHRRPLNVREILMHSSNIGSAMIARDLGTPRQRRFLQALGMLDETPVELPERGRPQVPTVWRMINTMTVAYGHGIAVSPLHVAAGVATLVNGGRYHAPTLVARTGPGAPPAPRGVPVLSPETSRHMRALMRLVVTRGTGSRSEVPGYFIGGKTGTADRSGAGGYDDRNGVLASFVGAFPIHDPHYVVLAVLDRPQGTAETYGHAGGGWVAAPVVGHVIKDIAPMLGVSPVPAEVVETALDLDREETVTEARLASY